MTGYLELFLKFPEHQLRNNGMPVLASFFGKSQTVFNVWEISFAAVQDRAPEAVRILHICGFLDRSAISAELFLNGTDTINPGQLVRFFALGYLAYLLNSSCA